MSNTGNGSREPRFREVYRSAIGIPLVAALMVISFTFGLRLSLAGEQSDLSGLLLGAGALAALSLAIATGVTHAAWRSSRRIRNLYKSAPCGYHFLDREGNFLEINDTELGWLLYSRDEFEGKKLADVMPAESLSRFQLHREKLEREGFAGTVEVEMVRKDGQRVPLLLSTAIVRNGKGDFLACRSTVFDLTDHKKVEMAHRQSEERLAHILETVAEAIFILDREGKITFANAAAEKLLGLSRQDFESRSYNDVRWKVTTVDGHPMPAEELPFARALKIGGPVFDIELAVEMAGERRMSLSVNASPLRDQAGAVIGVVASATDIGRRKEAERVQEELVSSVSQELRSPLSSLRGFAELMLTRTFSPQKQQEFMKVIHQETVRLTNLINDFLDLQRMGSRRQMRGFRAVHLSPLLRETLALFQGGGTHTLRLNLPHELPPVSADIDGLRQVVSNLVSNAMKFSPDGGQIEVGGRRDGKDIVLWVKDQGIGISPSEAAQLFTKFFRVRTVKTQGVGGAGLGLALVKQIVEAHRGRVWMESEAGKGSTFFFSMPLVQQAGSSPPGLTGQSVDIFLIEDDQPYARLLSDQFEADGLSVLWSRSGEEALGLIRASSPRLVLLDIQLGGTLDGWEILLALKSDPGLRAIPILIISAGEASNERGLAMSGEDLLLKPLSPTWLVEVVRQRQLSGSQVLIADNDPAFRRQVRECISGAGGFTFEEAVSGKEALSMIARRMPDLLILDLLMPEVDGFEVLRQLRGDRRASSLAVIVVTGKDLLPAEKVHFKNRMAMLVSKREASPDHVKKVVEQLLGLEVLALLDRPGKRTED